MPLGARGDQYDPIHPSHLSQTPPPLQLGMPLGAGGDQYDIAVEAILNATERLFNSMGNAQEMVRQAKILAEATSSLVNAIKLEAENESDPGESVGGWG